MLRPQIFTHARESPSLTSAPPPGTGAAFKLFSKEGSKIGLKCNKGALIPTHQNQIFWEGHISAPRGCCASKFLQALENDKVLLAQPAQGAEAPLTTFFKGESKIGLKCNKRALITSELKGVARRNFGT